MGRPQISCNGLGNRDFIRVDLPAARMIAVVDIENKCRMQNEENTAKGLSAGRLYVLPSFCILHSYFCISATLPGQDLNLDKESQNLLCYRYTTG